MSVQDPLAAVLAYLKADSGVSEFCGTRVYGEELPDAEIRHMPRQTVLVRDAGGATLGVGSRSFVPVVSPRIDVRCYGETAYRAKQLHLAVYSALKYLSRSSANSTLLHKADISGGPQSLRDPASEWRYILSSYVIIAAEQSVS